MFISGTESYQSPDTYIRVYTDRRETIVGSPPSQEEGALAFVDIDAPPASDVQSVIEALQYIPHALVGADMVLFRLPDITQGRNPAEEALADQRARDWARILSEQAPLFALKHRYTGVVRFRIGERPSVHWGERVPSLAEDVLLARACAVELLALLELGRGIWTPSDYHYQLPSGMHAESFVRIADAIRRPRDAMALATWLLPRMVSEIGVLLDSGTLTPLISSLQALVSIRGWRIGPITVLDEYPRTRVDAIRAARTASGGSGQVLGLLSVSSSGGIRDLLFEALESAAALDEWSLVVLADKLRPRSNKYVSHPTGHGTDRISTWLSLADRGLLSENESECLRCRSNKGARVVHIDPRTFSSMALPEPELLLPSTTDGRVNFRLWETAKSAHAIAIEALPYPSSLRSLPKHFLLPVRILLDPLFESQDFPAALKHRVGDIQNGTTEDDRITGAIIDQIPRCTAMVVTVDDADSDGFKSLLPQLHDSVGLPKNIQIFKFDSDKQSIEGGLENHENILVLCLGTVTGWTLRLLRIEVEEATRGADHKVLGLVIHARPTSAREWGTMRNQFTGNLGTIWLTYFPWRSPLSEESEVLKWVDTQRKGLSGEAIDFLDRRLAYCSPDDALLEWSDRVAAHNENPDREPDPGFVFWGQLKDDEPAALLGQSLYGKELDALTTYAGLGSAVHRNRTSARIRSAPEWRVFDLPNIFRSYFDALIVAAVLRWIEPSEAWWGGSPQEARRLMADLIARTKDRRANLRILLSELLLAAAQGKLHASAQEELLNSLPQLTQEWTSIERAPIEVGLRLVKEMIVLRHP